jgi:ATP-binding cassette subfamily B protein RaxB
LADIGLASTERESPGTHAESGGSRLATAGIELDRVAFAYDGGETLLLKHVSLRVAPGEMVAIVGRSGCGKTTLLKLMLGLLEPLSGDIRCNGRSLRKYGRAAVAPQSGAVMQGDVLLAGSVGENIAFFDDQPDVARIRRCARAAEIHDDIQQMPMAYNSLVGDLGDALSAGQRQRILLARALYRDPQILVLDEGTANLDGAAELRLVNRIRRMRMTRICVAHRAPRILAADRVLLLEDGALIETSKERLGLPGATNASCRQARATDATRSA